MASNGTAGRAPRVLDHVTAPYRGRGQFAGIVVGVGNGTVNVHFLDGDFAAGIDATAVSLYTGRRPRASAGLPLAVRMRVALLNAPETELVVVAFDDAYAVVSGPAGNRAYQRDVLRSFDDHGDDSSDEEAPAAPPLDAEDDDEALDAPAAPMDADDDDDDDAPVTPLLAVDETVLVGSNKHVAKVERATKPGDDVVLVRWQSTGHREEIDLSEVERLDLTAGRSSRRSTAAAREPEAPPAAAPRRSTPPAAVPEPRWTSPRTSPRSSPRPKTSSPPRTCFGIERPPATVEDVSASKRPCLNPASKRPYERPSLTEVNSADPEDDAELICRPKKSPAKRQRVTP